MNFFRSNRLRNAILGPSGSKGFSILELIITIGIVSVIGASAISNLATLKSPLDSGASTAVGFIKEVRAKAASTTAAYFITVSGNNKLITKYATNCTVVAASRTTDPALTLTLPTGVTIVNNTWAPCITSRGFASAASQLTIRDLGNRTRVIELFLGGAVRVQP